MAAPAEVNGGPPLGPVRAGPASRGPGTAGDGSPEETALPDAEPAAVGPPEAGLAEPPLADPPLLDPPLADAFPSEAPLADAFPSEATLADAFPSEATLADQGGADAEFGEPVPAGEGFPERGEPDAAAPEADLAEPGEPGQDAGGQSRDVRPLAVAGIIVGIIAMVGVAVGVLAVLTHGFRPKTVVTYRPAAVFGLRPGQCVDSSRNGLSPTVVPCATPHDAEVFASFHLPGGPWPGAAAVQQDAGNSCASRLSGYLNPAFATVNLTQEYVFPDRAAWRAGERTVVCEVRAHSGQLTGSVRA
jgi:hypothetical protein